MDSQSSVDHPSVYIREIMKQQGLNQANLAELCNISCVGLNALLTGRRGVTARTAILLGKELKIDPEYLMNLQSKYDLDKYHRSVKESTCPQT